MKRKTDKLRPIPDSLIEEEGFSRQDFVREMSCTYDITVPQISYELKKQLDSGTIVRSGWGQYAFPRKRVYSWDYSKEATSIAEELRKDYDGLDFQIFELRQLNEFMNHQIAHNAIFVYVENDLVNFAFDTLWNMKPGKVLLKPGANQYFRYRQDDEIIVNRLPSETPKGHREPWKSRLEKVLVDVFTDKLVSSIVPEGEKEAILDGAFQNYLLDKGTMLRYAKRKGAEKKIAEVLEGCEKRSTE